MAFKRSHILNPLFLLCLAVLLLNDHLLKDTWHNTLTGKLSDVSGMVVFVLFLCSFTLPKHKGFIYILSALAFMFWKSSLSEPFIGFWNNYISIWPVERTIDYSDLFCLIVLVPLYVYEPKEISIGKTKWLTYPVMSLVVFAISATSRARPFIGNEIYISEFMKLDMTKAEFLQQLEKDKISYKMDSVFIFQKDTFNRIVMDHLFLGGDSIRTATIGIRDKKRNKLEVYLHNLVISGRGGYFFKDYKALSEWTSRYKVDTRDFFKNLDKKPEEKK